MEQVIIFYDILWDSYKHKYRRTVRHKNPVA